MDQIPPKINTASPSCMDRSKNVENVLLAFICALILLLISGCLNNRFYQPDQILYKTPDQYNLDYEDVFFKSKDGTKLHGWFLPAVGDAVGTIIHFHGNFGNLTYYLDQISWLPVNNFNVFTFDYRGYGRSEGTPSRHRIYEDCVAAIEYVMSQPAIATGNVYVFGQSLGGANAIVAIAKNDFSEIRAVAVEGAFYSYREEARDMMRSTAEKEIGNMPFLSQQIWLFSFFAVTNFYSPAEFIDRVSPSPLLLIHCTEDSTVSYHHSERLHAKAGEPKYLWIIDGCSHLQVFTDQKTEYGYRQKLMQFFNDHRQHMK